MISLQRLILRMRQTRGAQLFVVVLRLLLGFAFLPAGLKKVLGQPFTDPHNHGPFHDFLHAFRETGLFYGFVGALQLVVAALLMTQRFAALGALLSLPIISAIMVFCWSTWVVPTATVASLMWLGTVGLLCWEVDRWRRLLSPVAPADDVTMPVLVDLSLWARCGALILLGYLAVTALAGEVYRPRGVEPDRPAFYILCALPLLPIGTWWVERRGAKRSAP